MDLVSQVRSNLQGYELLSRGSRVVVAVSGGADSVALLWAVHRLRHELGLTIIVAHFDHAFRRGSAVDQRFVARLAETLSIPFVTATNRRKMPVTGSLEEFARNIRYDFLCRVARQAKADAIAVAHTLDDQAETVLMRIMRGTGPSGLQAMGFRRRMQGVTIIRPLLNCSRQQVEDFLRTEGVSFRTDPTNRSPRFTRNKVRLTLMPYLQNNFCPDIKVRLAALADVAGTDHDFLQERALEAFGRFVEIRRGRAVISLSSFSKLHVALRRMILRILVSRMQKVPTPWDLRHIDLMNRFLCASPGGVLSLPQGMVLTKAKGDQRAILKNS